MAVKQLKGKQHHVLDGNKNHFSSILWVVLRSVFTQVKLKIRNFKCKCCCEAVVIIWNNDLPITQCFTSIYFKCLSSVT